MSILKEALERFRGVFQSLNMSYISIGFYSVEETFGGEFVPVFESFLFWQLVKSVVDLYGVEMLCVVLEPFALGQTGRIEQFLPVVIIPS